MYFTKLCVFVPFSIAYAFTYGWEVGEFERCFKAVLKGEPFSLSKLDSNAKWILEIEVK